MSGKMVASASAGSVSASLFVCNLKLAPLLSLSLSLVALPPGDGKEEEERLLSSLSL